MKRKTFALKIEKKTITGFSRTLLTFTQILLLQFYVQTNFVLKHSQTNLLRCVEQKPVRTMENAEKHEMLSHPAFPILKNM